MVVANGHSSLERYGQCSLFTTHSCVYHHFDQLIAFTCGKHTGHVYFNHVLLTCDYASTGWGHCSVHCLSKWSCDNCKATG